MKYGSSQKSGTEQVEFFSGKTSPSAGRMFPGLHYALKIMTELGFDLTGSASEGS